MTAPPASDAEPRRRQFATMGTFGELLLFADPEVAEPQFDAVIAELGRIQAAFTRFEPTSPIEQLNDSGGGPVDDELREILVAADAAWRATDGRFDIGVGAELIAAGYDRDFDELEQANAPTSVPAPTIDDAVPPALAPAPAERSWLDPSGLAANLADREPAFTFDASGDVGIRPGVRLDLGGIAKGWAADHVRALLAPYGTCLVNLGGDVSIHVVEGDEPWPIGVELGPQDGAISVALAYGGLATSGQDRRVWRRAGADAGETAHHIIDPHTGRPSRSDILRISVVGATCMDAEVWTKALLMAGVDGAREEAERRGITALIIGLDGRSWRTGSLAGS